MNNTEVELTNREFMLLEVLIKNRNIALSRERLLDLVLGYDFEGGYENSRCPYYETEKEAWIGRLHKNSIQIRLSFGDIK